MDQCPRCGIEMNEGEKDTEFYDEFSESTLKLSISAIWCDSCQYFKIGVN